MEERFLKWKKRNSKNSLYGRKNGRKVTVLYIEKPGLLEE
jgi:hypothetical protein